MKEIGKFGKICLLSLCFVLCVTLSWAKEIKIAVFPFEIHAPTDLSYVREGIQDMLSTRLCVPGKTIIIDEVKVREALASLKGPLTESKAKEIGQKLGADYVLYGSVTTFGQKASLDAKLIPVKEDKPPLALYTTTNSLDDFIPKLSDFAYQALAYIEGAPLQPVRVATAAPPASPTPSGGTAPVAPQPQAPQGLTPGASPTTPAPSPSSPPNAATLPPPPPDNPAKMHPERIFREQSLAQQPRQEVPSTPVQTPEEVSSQAKAQVQQAKASKYRYSDIDPWPDYPPEEEDLAPIVEEPTKKPSPKKEKKKKSFWSKLWPGNWFGGKKEEEVVLNPEENIPPPPPPSSVQQPNKPSVQAPPPPPAPQTQSQLPEGYAQPTPAPEAPSSPAPQTPPPSQGTWQWY